MLFRVETSKLHHFSVNTKLFHDNGDATIKKTNGERNLTLGHVYS